MNFSKTFSENNKRFLLLDSSSEGSAQTAQIKLKRTRLADDLNERIALRPGPLELVEKNIIPLESTVKEAMKGGTFLFFVVVAITPI